MPLTASRLLSVFGIPLVGIAAFAFGLVVSTSRSADDRAHAQDECVQPSETGCPLVANTPVQAALETPTDSHTWLFSIVGVPDFSVSLIGLPGNYSLSVFRPDGSLLAMSNTPGLQDEVVRAIGADDGTYTIIVSSPDGDSSPISYTVFANPTGPEESPVPFDTYAPPVRGFTPY